MKSVLRDVTEKGVRFKMLAFVCPGCVELVSGTGLHLLVVNEDMKKSDRPSWEWNGDLEAPTLSPSILTTYPHGTADKMVCHSFLKEGVFHFLDDCTHSMAGKQVPMPDLPEWFYE